jgi:pyruvate,water dikinase
MMGLGEATPFTVAWDDPADAEYTWVRVQRGFEQGALARLQEDVLSVYAEGARVCFEETGVPMARNHIVRFFNGFNYARSPQVDEGEVSRRVAQHEARDRAYRKRGTTLHQAEIEPQVVQAMAELDRFRPRGASIPALFQHLERTIRIYGHVMGDLHWRMAGGIRLDWPSTYRDINGEPEVASGTLLQAIPNKTTRLVRWLRNLARQVQSDPDLRAVFQDRSYQDLQEPPMRHRPGVRRFRARFRNLLHHYGHRNGRGFGSGTSFTTPTWNMEHSQPLDLIASYSQQDLDALDRLDAEARLTRQRAERRVRRLLASDQERLQRFNEQLALAVEVVQRMENHNQVMEQGIHGVLREAVDWLGRGLVKEKTLSHPDDVLHLSLAELRDMANGGGSADPKALVAERATEMEERSRLWAPPTLGHGGPLPPDPRAAFTEPPSSAGLDGLLLRGTGASPGKVTGRARVVPMGPTPPKVEKGDILVAVNASPAWTPIFPMLGGLVLDAGAVFQHAALVAREYGIPAVIMTRDATNVILDGQSITLDADQGIVELMP